jgi:hypothetical protein
VVDIDVGAILNGSKASSTALHCDLTQGRQPEF